MARRNGKDTMIIACPACNTRYAVPDEAIGIEGRTVRCAKCKHNWFQDGPELAPREEKAEPTVEPTPAKVAEPEPDATADEDDAQDLVSSAREPTNSEVPAAVDAADHDTAEATSPEELPTDAAADTSAQPSVAHWRTSDQAGDQAGHRVGDQDSEQTETPTDETIEPEAPTTPPPAYVHSADPERVDVGPADHDNASDDLEHSEEIETFYVDADEPSQFDYEPPFRARRNPLKMWTAAGVIFAILAFGTIIGVNYWGLPDWVPVEQPTFGVEEPDLLLDFPADQQDRRTLPNGTEYFGASGTVTNIGRSTINVPSILIVLRDERGRIVYNWEVVPPQSQLAPGATMTVKEAVTDVPRSAKIAEIGWKPS